MRRANAFTSALLAVIVPAGVAAGDEVYRGYLDPAIAHHAAAIETLKAIEASPEDAGLRNDLACLIAWDGFYKDALRELDKAAELAPKDSRPLFNAGLVQAMRGEWGAARKAFRKATKRDPGNWPAWWMLGLSEEKLGNARSAVAAYKRSLRVDTSLFSVRVNPFAAATQLKSRVLLETYQDRLARASAPFANQLAGAERLAPFFQPMKPRPDKPAGEAPAPAQAEAADAGPVVTSVAPPAAPPSGPPRRTQESASSSGRSSIQLSPDGSPRRRDRRLTEQPPEPPAPPPMPVPESYTQPPTDSSAPQGSTTPPGAGPGGGVPQPGQPPAPGPGGG